MANERLDQPVRMQIPQDFKMHICDKFRFTTFEEVCLYYYNLHEINTRGKISPLSLTRLLDKFRVQEKNFKITFLR